MTTVAAADPFLVLPSPHVHGRCWDIRDTGTRPLTVNEVARLHRQQWATHTRRVREQWHWLTLSQRVPRLERALFVVLPLHKDRRSPQDPGACAPEAKAAIDGIVAAGVLPDDSARHVVSVIFLGPHVAGVDGLTVRVREVVE